MRRAIRAGVFITVAGISIATKFSDRSAVAEETKAQMLDICAVDDACIEVVDTYFERCFSTHYNMGRYSSGRLNMEGVADCINDYGQAEYFVVE